MSSPNTNIEREVKRHRPALIGLVVAGGAVLLLILGFAMWTGVPMEDQAASPLVGEAGAPASQ